MFGAPFCGAGAFGKGNTLILSDEWKRLHESIVSGISSAVLFFGFVRAPSSEFDSALKFGNALCVNVAVLQLGQSCKLRPRGSEVLVLRAFRPSLINEPLMEAVELRRGAKVLLVPHENQLKCYVRKEAASRNLEATQPAESNGTGASDVQGCC
ncbi:unnamed protein product [Effrenium voratum]|nr:unnamed protein product [Effrenium voratum]